MPRLVRLAPLLAASLCSAVVGARTAAAQSEPDAPPAAAPTPTPVPVQGPVIIETPNVVITTDAPPPAPTPPSAAPAPAPAPDAAPHNAEWKDVSHINGQLVPVGQRNDYVYKFRRTNISTNPVGWMAGFFGVSVSHAVTDNIVLRGDLNVMNPGFEGDTWIEAGMGVPLYFRRAYQGAFLEPGFIVRSHSEDRDCYDGYESYDCGGDSDTKAGPQMLFGWHWTWDSGFNVAAAVGLGRYISGNDDEYDDTNGIFGNGYFRVGYAF